MTLNAITATPGNRTKHPLSIRPSTHFLLTNPTLPHLHFLTTFYRLSFVDCHEAMVSTGIVSIIEAISHSLNADSIHEIVAGIILYNTTHPTNTFYPHDLSNHNVNTQLLITSRL